ncbi:MAG: xanthine dehydrogenase family protein molybdopterin-binding subunit, partial [Actinobacteria bacterium]|nr:xanthine dehydrogenase family protein molybdopterin-binding subunit [Actinomycetota bacterium]
MTVTTEHELGRDRRRKEDAHLITGRTTWTDNMTRAGTLHLAVLRSPVAHARLTKVDVSPALEREGVVAAFTGADLADDAGGLPTAWVVTEDMVHPEHKAVAVDEVRHVGEIIAVVAATDRYTAADAVEAIDVEFEQLPAVLDMEEALKDGAPLVHSDKGTNKTYTWTFDSAGAGT